MQTTMGRVHLMKSKALEYFILLTIITAAILLTGCATSRQDRERSASHVTMGTAYLKSGQFSPALREFLVAQRLSPDDPETYYYTGLSYYGNGMKKEAKGQFEAALSIKPDYSEANNYLGTIYMEEGLYDRAIEAFDRALSNMLYETPAIALNNIGWAYHKKGDYQTALTKYEAALKREPGTIIRPLIQKNRGIAYLAGHNIDKAIFYLKKAIDSAPGMTESHYWLGISYLEGGNREKAIQELRFAAKTNPESVFGLKAREKLDSLVP
ncbi:MAG: tetratricopeptide repeat protein [Syntrophobacterales bacterium]|nr:MAG: tetratricopeptide repeat protein [Syntrophobacterales bacterium]